MKNPKLIVKPFAKNGQKNVIPENYETSMESNQATWDQGFGQITMLPVAAGGLPPKGQDFNGIFNQISENIVYLSQGGRFKFSAEYAEAIGGYPKGAILQSDDEKKEYLSLIDNNKVDFNTAADISASWKLVNTDDLLAQIASKQPKGDYATKSELNSGLSGKQPVGDYATKTEVNSKLAKDQNGADIPNKDTFIKNLGLPEKYLSLSGGTITGGVEIKTSGRSLKFTAPTETSSSYMEFYGGEKRTAYIGYGSESTTALTINNEKTNVIVRISDDLTVNGYRVLTEEDTRVPIGGSVIWNSSAPIPGNFWPNEGRSFSATDYPELAKVFPSMKLPDDRGYAIRIADNGKGIDSGRTVGTYQEDAMQPMSGWMGGIQTRGNSYGTGVFSNRPTSTKSSFSEGASAVQDFTFDSSEQVRTANETRMKNVAKILITRIK